MYEEIFKCIKCFFFGLYCVFFVVGIFWFMKEEIDIIDYFVRYFGKDIFCYFIIVFIRRDDFEYDGIDVEEYWRMVFESL